MKSLVVAALAAALSAPALAAAPDAAKPKKAAAPALSRTSGVVNKLAGDRLILTDKAGHVEEFVATPKTRVTRDGKRAKFAAAPGDVVVKALYDPKTKELSSLILKTAPARKPDADDAKRAAVQAQGEVAGTDILKGTISVRLGGGATTEFKVVDATKIAREAEGKPAEAISLEAVKVGDRVEVLTKDWKTADELHVRPAAR